MQPSMVFLATIPSAASGFRRVRISLPESAKRGHSQPKRALTKSVAMSDSTDRCRRVHRIGEMSWCRQLDWL